MLHPITENVWTLRYPLKMLGLDQQRVVTVLRLTSGDLVVHSTGPFTAAEVTAVRALGTVKWMVEGLLLHDTFAKEGREAFPEAEYLAPPGFTEMAKVPAGALIPSPAAWGSELEVQELEGQSLYREHVFFHAPSRTLIVADLLFHFPNPQGPWEKLMRRTVMGLTNEASTNRVFALAVKDRAAFQASMERVFAWDFDRIIVGHGDLVPSDGKRVLREALERRGLLESAAA